MLGQKNYKYDFRKILIHILYTYHLSIINISQIKIKNKIKVTTFIPTIIHLKKWEVLEEILEVFCIISTNLENSCTGCLKLDASSLS